ncbi:MAG TPA: HD domain-containing phosphohydrolase [Symbiobacteriaceae bacterium]|nr:HD domain-containing phosphohydrolase [Symbiobacteriaceae bacterium]
MSARQGQGATPLEQSAAVRARILIPIVLAGLVLAFELVWKPRLITPGSWSDRMVNVALFLVLGPAMAWWGRTMARGIVQRLATAEAASEEKSRFLEQRNRQLQTVLQASRAMTAVLDLDQVAHLVIEQVTAFTRFTRACLLLGSGETDSFRMAAAHGLPPAFLAEFTEGITGQYKSSSPVEWCRVTRQPVVVENLGRDFRTAGMRSVFALAQVEGMIAIPLLYQDQFRGALVVFEEQGGAISTSEISLVSALACQAALALENARLYTLTAYHRSRLDTALEIFRNVASALARPRSGVSSLLHTVAQMAARLCAPARIHLVVTKSGRQSPITVVESVGLEGEPSGGPAAELPVVLDGERYGQMDVYLPEGRSLEPAESQVLQAFINLAASALATATVVADMRQTVEVVEGAYMGTLEALTKALEMRDHETEGHSRRVVQYTLSLAQQLGVPEAHLVTIMRGALLHDIGKIGIPDAILKKQGPLDPAEWTVMRQHPRIGYEMLKNIEFLREATPIILHHHERFNGSGYPEGLAGEAIPLGARIFAVADAYDAITSDRPYRKGRAHEAAMAEIMAGAGAQFDPQVVEALKALPQEELARIRGRDLDTMRQ